jgi:hypothetical protein
MVDLRILRPGITEITGSSPVLIADDTMGAFGGYIMNPFSADDQGIAVTEGLYINLITPSFGPSETAGTVRLAPGQSFLTPPYSNVWVIAKTSGHKFTCYFSAEYEASPAEIVPGQPGSGVQAVGGEPGSGIFPPPGVTGLTTVIPSYLYQQYTDDDDLWGWIDAQNNMQQNFVDTFNALNLPIYPGPIVSNLLLDWVGRGLYGMARPALGSGIPAIMGPLNTYGCDWLAPKWEQIGGSISANFGLNMIAYYGPENVVIATDDVYRRVLTWHFYKGDGNYFSTRFLKRRIWGFLFGKNGWRPDSSWDRNLDAAHPPGMADSDDDFIANTQQISVSIGANRNVTIRFILGKRTVTGGAMLNTFGCNGFGINSSPLTFLSNQAPDKWPPVVTSGPMGPYHQYTDIQLNDIGTWYEYYPPLPFTTIFKQALDSGVLEVPYQYNFTCNIG